VAVADLSLTHVAVADLSSTHVAVADLSPTHVAAREKEERCIQHTCVPNYTQPALSKAVVVGVF